ncbi:hypothetical protein BKA70DRAFT_1343681 [Coprinopsis sp. MPI-PUGE-AT-0042]|nr:hypothetical protein BKA70DRAFT_1343681 [Coprinopsis sp. MPI-PUGE-AT-0042]
MAATSDTPMRITPQLIQDAGRGNLAQLRNLAMGLDRINYTPDVLDAPIAILDDLGLSAIPRPLTPSWATLRVEAFKVLFAALIVLDGLDEKDRKKIASADKLHAWADSLVTSVHVCVTCAPVVYQADELGEFFCSVALSILACLDLDKRISKKLLSSREIVESVLIIWSYPRTDAPHQLYHGWNGHSSSDSCEIQMTMQSLVEDAISLEILSDVLLESAQRLQRFAYSTCARIEQLGKLYRVLGVDAMDIQEAYVALSDTVDALVANPAIYPLMRKAQYLGSFAFVVESISDALPEDDALRLALHLLQRATSPLGNPIQSLQDAFSGGLFPVIAKALAGCTSEQRVALEQLFCRLGAYSCHPRVLRILQRSLTTIPPHLVRQISQRPLVGRRWSSLVSIINNMSSILQVHANQKGSKICDNDVEHSEASWSSKACSQCHLVVYCSSACQKQDWSRRHRDECSVMQNTFHRRQQQEFRYSQETRRFHLGFIQDIFRKQHRELEATPDGLSYNDSVVIVDVRSCKDARMHVIRRYPLFAHLEARIVGDCPALEARASALIAKLRGTTRPNTRVLLEMEIAWNARRGIALLVEMMKTGAGEWEPRSSVVRLEKISEK